MSIESLHPIEKALAIEHEALATLLLPDREVGVVGNAHLQHRASSRDRSGKRDPAEARGKKCRRPKTRSAESLSKDRGKGPVLSLTVEPEPQSKGQQRGEGCEVGSWRIPRRDTAP